MNLYSVNGFSWDKSSWTPTYLKYQAGEIIDSRPEPYKIGTELDFSIEGNASYFTWDGWSGPESQARWTDSDTAILSIPIESVQGDLLMTCKFRAFVPDGVGKQRVIVNVNGVTVGSLEVTENELKEYAFTIPEDIFDDLIEIVFELPDATSPSEHGISNDSRKLGIALRTMRLQDK